MTRETYTLTNNRETMTNQTPDLPLEEIPVEVVIAASTFAKYCLDQNIKTLTINTMAGEVTFRPDYVTAKQEDKEEELVSIDQFAELLQVNPKTGTPYGIAQLEEENVQLQARCCIWVNKNSGRVKITFINGNWTMQQIQPSTQRHG